MDHMKNVWGRALRELGLRGIQKLGGEIGVKVQGKNGAYERGGGMGGFFLGKM